MSASRNESVECTQVSTRAAEHGRTTPMATAKKSTGKGTPKRASKAKPLEAAAPIVVAERIESAIVLLRGEKVLLDHDLAALYGVEPRSLIQAVKRNLTRFPEDFMFQLSQEELQNLRSQFVISSSHGGRRYLPYAFTEHGVTMLSSVLRSERAVLVNIEVVRAFVRLRRLLATHQDLARKLTSLEKKYDAQFRVVFDAIRDLMTPPTPPKRRIGFGEK